MVGTCEPCTLTVALPSVGGVAIVTGHAALAVHPCRQVPTVLAHAAVHTPAVTITLARWEETTDTCTRVINTHPPPPPWRSRPVH